MKKALAHNLAPQTIRKPITHRVPLISGLTLLGLLAGLGLFASRPAHTAGGPVPVTVANAIANHDLDNAARQPFGIRVFPSPKTFSTFVVPAGKRLVIQQISAFSFGSTTVEDVAVYTTTSGTGTALVVPYTVNNHGVVYAMQAVTDYADPGSTVTIAIDDANQNDTAGHNVDIHGYYVDVP